MTNPIIIQKHTRFNQLPQTHQGLLETLGSVLNAPQVQLHQ